MAKTMLTIGAGPGIGFATAQRFAAEGYRIVLVARNSERLNQQAAVLREGGAEVQTQVVDARNALEVGQLVASIGDDLNVLHYNAGVLHYDQNGALQMQPLESQSVESLVSDTTINISSALVAVQAAARIMKAKRSGTILLTGGFLAVQPSADLLTLSIGKAGIRTAAQALFEPLKAQGVHIATVTVGTLVSPDSKESREIAEVFWGLHEQAGDAWTWEHLYT